VEKLLLTADNRPVANYETNAMRELAINLGVPESALIQDSSGFSTLVSCQRAGSVYHVSSVLIVSQYFQLPRAMFLCESSGLEVAGIASANGSEDLKSLILWYLREIPATVLALFQAN
jgi:vancomycin permeability regulator SanA